jgi:hypothetical protein
MQDVTDLPDYDYDDKEEIKNNGQDADGKKYVLNLHNYIAPGIREQIIRC